MVVGAVVGAVVEVVGVELVGWVVDLGVSDNIYYVQSICSLVLKNNRTLEHYNWLYTFLTLSSFWH